MRRKSQYETERGKVREQGNRTENQMRNRGEVGREGRSEEGEEGRGGSLIDPISLQKDGVRDGVRERINRRMNNRTTNMG